MAEIAPDTPDLPFRALTSALAEPVRWAILRELAKGERLMVIEIAKKLGKPADLISKHLAVLRKLGLVAIRQRLQYIPKEFLSNDPEKNELDLGYCVLRLDTIPE